MRRLTKAGFRPAVRLNAKPTRPHSTKHGAKGYSRTKAAQALRRAQAEE